MVEKPHNVTCIIIEDVKNLRSYGTSLSHPSLLTSLLFPSLHFSFVSQMGGVYATGLQYHGGFAPPPPPRGPFASPPHPHTHYITNSQVCTTYVSQPFFQRTVSTEALDTPYQYGTYQNYRLGGLAW